MEIELTAEQRAFRESCGKLAAHLASRWHRGRGPHDVGPSAPDEASWSRVAEAGWLAMRLREENGGAEAGAVDMMILAEQLGHHAVASPVLGTVIAAEQLQSWGAASGLLEEIAEGTRRLAPALTPDLTGFADATRSLAWDAAGAEFAVVPAAGTAYALGEPVPFADQTRAVRPLGEPVRTLTELTAPDGETAARTSAFALSLLVADLLGTMQAALDAALDHARTRVQFGSPVGAFQAVQQLLADSHVLTEASRSACWYAAWAVDALPGEEALRAARVAKAYASRSAVEVCENVIQVFGGIGMTWEAPAHIWLRRAHAARAAFGDEHHHEAVIAATEFSGS
ncbi:acyl-CoA dehydrogenase family protein [Nonomuraea ferruginea]|uniref:Acyl-CoA/acyl-ACP dehydrogenase n=1 Tax=Nonomuraea ferruginea TaxID=46174 RepID=A0ABT4SYD1_9ACTN|nr:acyl-CoA dehydrogenase family protein [Nonomuraea ferruginea]MDA0642241.1 acyl-CoA/acyl-ACP dehydrogenase [Nonomuraea ferruginea]